MRREINVLVLTKGAENFIYVYDDPGREKLLNAVRDHAADPELALNWFDADALTRRVYNPELAEMPR